MSAVSRQQKRASQRAMLKHTGKLEKAGLRKHLVQRLKDFIKTKVQPK